MTPKRGIVAFCSGGNDSVALLQLLHEARIQDVHVVYSDTKWAAAFWPERIEAVAAWAVSLGFLFHRTESIGMEALVRAKKGWPMPRAGAQFCTLYLKIIPALTLLDDIDPLGMYTCAIGVRREESANRAQFPVYTERSDKHGDRGLWAPMAEFDEVKRDSLLARSPFKKLGHRSAECFPCIYANRADLRALREPDIARIERIENEMGTTANDRPRTMFRPYRYMGATGIREVVRWANSARGRYRAPAHVDGCDSGFCGA